MSITAFPMGTIDHSTPDREPGHAPRQPAGPHRTSPMVTATPQRQAKETTP